MTEPQENGSGTESFTIKSMVGPEVFLTFSKWVHEKHKEEVPDVLYRIHAGQSQLREQNSLFADFKDHLRA